jgi:AcrR family transcriptional regulator
VAITALDVMDDQTRPTKVSRDPERTSAAILAAAIQEFAENSLGGARVDAIASRSGVNKRMIYHYFGSKEQLYTRCLQEIYRNIRSSEQDLALADLEPVAAIRELCRFTWDFYLKTPEFLSLLATENLNRGAFLRDAPWRPNVNSSIVGVLTDVLTRGADAGLFRPNVDPIDIYVTLAGIGYFYLSNKYTLSASFNRDFLDPVHLTRWGDHMADVVIAYLKV